MRTNVENDSGEHNQPFAVISFQRPGVEVKVSALLSKEGGKDKRSGRLLVEVLQHGFCAGADVQLLVDVPEVSADSFNTEEKLVGNFLVMEPFRKVREDFQLTVRKILSFRG